MQSIGQIKSHTRMEYTLLSVQTQQSTTTSTVNYSWADTFKCMNNTTVHIQSNSTTLNWRCMGQFLFLKSLHQQTVIRNNCTVLPKAAKVTLKVHKLAAARRKC